MERLRQHYQHCLSDRFDLWFGKNAVSVAHVGDSWTLVFHERSAGLTFLPEGCSWTAQADGKVYQGTFDKMSKRIRQYFSGISLP